MGHNLYFKLLLGTSLVCEFLKLYIINCSCTFLKELKSLNRMKCFEICLSFGNILENDCNLFLRLSAVYPTNCISLFPN